MDGDGCSATCTIESYCGDGTLDVVDGEECDDGNTVDGDGCSSTCLIEEVDEPEPFSEPLPEPEPVPEAVCGNGIMEDGEQCDDGNTDDGDGCSALCVIEEEPEPICGNGIVEDGEECDDGNTTDGDGCSSLCLTEEVALEDITPLSTPVCGNGVVEDGEECDDGNIIDGDGCSAICTIETASSPPPPPPCVESDYLTNTASEVCPDTPIVISLPGTTGATTNFDPEDFIYGIEFGQTSSGTPTVSFKVDNPLSDDADFYVRYSKPSETSGFSDPACESVTGQAPCEEETTTITAACTHLPNTDPFSIVNIYLASQEDPFVSFLANASEEINKCCHPREYDETYGVARYAVEIKCSCPPLPAPAETGSEEAEDEGEIIRINESVGDIVPINGTVRKRRHLRG